MEMGPPVFCDGDFYALHDQDSLLERNGIDFHDGISTIAKISDQPQCVSTRLLNLRVKTGR